MKIIRRKHRLYEEGEQNNVQQAAPAIQPNAATPQAAPAALAAGQQPAQQQPAAPAQNQVQQQQPAQQQNQQQQNQQQPAQQEQQKADPKQAELANKVKTFMDSFREQWDKNDIFWALAYNLPDALSEAVPEFKQDNAAAKPAIDAWGKFKNSPNKESFGTFITELTKFGGGPETEGNSVEAAQNTAAQNQNQQQQDAAVAKNQSNESLSMTFGEKLQKRLMEEKRTDYVRGLMEDGWYRLK